MSRKKANPINRNFGFMSGLVSRVSRKRLVRDGLWVAFGHMITIVAGIISIRIFTEMLPAAVFGGANLMIGMLTLGLNVLLSPISQTQVRYHIHHHQLGDSAAYTRIMAFYAARSALALSAAAAVIIVLLPAARSGASLWIIPWIIFWAAATAARATLITPVQAERRMRLYSAWVGSEAILIMLCTAFALHLYPSIEGYLAGQALGVALGTLIFGRFKTASIEQAQREALVSEVRAQIVRYGLPFLPFAVLGFAYGQTDRYILAATLNTAAVGQYAAAFAIASRIPSIAGRILTDTFRPILFEAESGGDLARGKKVFRAWIIAMSTLSIVVALCVYFLGELVAQVFLAASYRPGARDVMALVALGFGFNSVAQIIENRLLSFGTSSVLLWTKFAGGAANIACAFVFIPAHGILGAALANALGQFVMLVATYVALLLTPSNARLAAMDQKSQGAAV